MNSSPSPSVKFPLLWLDDLRRQAEAQRTWLWQGYVAPGNVTLLTSQWKAGKTTLLSILLDRMKAGGTLAGRPGRGRLRGEPGPLALAQPEVRLRRAHLLAVPALPQQAAPGAVAGPARPVG